MLCSVDTTRDTGFDMAKIRTVVYHFLKKRVVQSLIYEVQYQVLDEGEDWKGGGVNDINESRKIIEVKHYAGKELHSAAR